VAYRLIVQKLFVPIAAEFLRYVVSSTMNHSDLIGKKYDRATIFEPGFLTGYRQSEIKDLVFGTVLGQDGDRELTIQFVFKSKRKKQQRQAAQTVIIEGWDHPELEWGMTAKNESGLVSTEAKFTAFSDQWDVLLDEYLAEVMPTIIFDGRDDGGSLYAPTEPESRDGSRRSAASDRDTRKSPFPGEVNRNPDLWEGAAKQMPVNRYERNPVARQQCLDHYGYTCQACEVSMEQTYGELGRDFIHVHHKVPISEIREAYEVDPINDLVPICPNCHAMLHRPKETLSVESLREIIKRSRQDAT